MSGRLLVVIAVLAAACNPGAADAPATTEPAAPAAATSPDSIATTTTEAPDTRGMVIDPPTSTTTIPQPITTTTSPPNPTTTSTSTTTEPAPPTTIETPPPTTTGTSAPTTTVPPPTTTTTTTTTMPGIAAVTAADLGSSWRPGCPVDPADLAAVTVRHLTFEGSAAEGTIVVHADVAADVRAVFARLWEIGFPISQVVPVDRFGSSDDASMAANNTSGFNCRLTTGGSRWSEHAYGRAIDVNPIQNPYVRGATILPPAGSTYVDRSVTQPGMVTPEVVAAFAAVGWSWGGHWSSPDYQHFSTSGR